MKTRIGGCSLVVEHLLSMHKALNSIPITANEKKLNKNNLTLHLKELKIKNKLSPKLVEGRK
jgi:hypothetical protein